MKFTERLYLETKDAHKIVDNHIFVKLIRKNKIAADLYINLNKICIFELQKYINLSDKILQEKLYRDIEQPDMYIIKPLSELLSNCKRYPIELGYMMLLGLLFGGNILKKLIPDPSHQDFLTFHNPKELVIDFKEYLDNHVNDHDSFINGVNDSYKLIAKCFDYFVTKITDDKYTL